MFQNPKPSRLLEDTLVGYRYWTPRAADGMLFSMNNTMWPPTGLQAICTQHIRTPDKEDGCGIYASKTLEWLVRQFSSLLVNSRFNNCVVGIVHMWGHFIEYDEGYRAEWATPVVLYYQKHNYEIAAKAGKLYNCILEPWPDVQLPPRVEEGAAYATWRQQQRDAARQRYKDKMAERKKVLEKAKEKGWVDESGKLTDKGHKDIGI